jgi:hypothetical protein
VAASSRRFRDAPSRDSFEPLKRSELTLVLLPVLFALILGLLQAITWSDRVGWDSVSYLDLAEAWRRGNLELAVSPYWSPLYPIAFAITSAVFSAPPERVTLCYFQYGNFLFFAFASFLFWKNLACADKFLSDKNGTTPLPTVPLYFFGACISAFGALVTGDLAVKSPDMLASALFLLANALFLSLVYSVSAKPWRLIFMGIVMGSTYLAKSFFISWILPTLVLLAWQRKNFHLTFKSLLLVAIPALLVVASYAVPLSLKMGHPTISEAGQYQFVFCTIPLVEGTHAAPELVTQQPKHPTRVFFENPNFYEFAEPFEVSYSPWFNPHYWNEGAKAYVDFKIRADLMYGHAKIIIVYIGILAVFLMAYIAVLNRSFLNFSLSRIILLSPLVLTSNLCIVLFFLVTIQPRYIIGFVPALMGWLLLTCRYPQAADGQKQCSRMLWVASWLVIIVVMIASMLHIYFAVPQLGETLKKSTGLGFPTKPLDQHGPTAAKLRELGLKPHDWVARISLFENGEFYWARCAEMRIVAESFDPKGFFSSPPERRQELYAKLRAFGVKAIVLDWSYRAPLPVPVPNEDGWTQIPGTSNYVKRLVQE